MSTRFVRSSKFRHVFGKAPKNDATYSTMNITKSPQENNMSSVNGKFLAVAREVQGGGSFIVLPLEKVGRVDLSYPLVAGHSGPVLDLQWDPFDEHVIASGSEDCTVKVWQIPEGGLVEKMSEPLVTLEGHLKKVTLVSWHPTAKDVLVSGGADNVILIWNVKNPSEPLITLDTMFADNINSFTWNDDGSLFAVTTKDKKITVVDPRDRVVVSQGTGHQSTKPSKAVFCGNKLFTTGFAKTTERQYGLWDPYKLDKALILENIDSGSGVTVPFWDPGTQMVYLVGKGDTQIRYFEVTEEPPSVFFLSMHQGTQPHRGCCAMPRRHLDYKHCEVARFFRLLHTKDVVEPLPMTVPRKSELFQADLYPPAPAGKPALTADEWIAGVNKPPIMVKFTKDGLVELAPGEASSGPPKVAAAGGEPRTLEEYKVAYRTLQQENKRLKEQLGQK